MKINRDSDLFIKKVAVPIYFLFYFLFSAAGFSSAEVIQNDDCLACHDQISVEQFTASAHKANLCTSCHQGIVELPHPETLPKVSCAGCHRTEAVIYNNSDHGKALKFGVEAVSCLNCHGETHAIFSARDPRSPVYRLRIPETCATCHEDEKKMAQFNLLERAPVKSYFETIHGKALHEEGMLSAAVCTDCHGSHDLHRPTNPESKIFRANVPSTCGKCHENVLKTYQQSVHGKAALSGKHEAPVCTDCHGEHTIKSHLDPASTVFTTVVSEKTCGHCHGAEKIATKYRLPSNRLKTYLESYHGLASQYGVTTVANCASCHGAHDILPSNDPNSSVNKKNLPQTCGKCHPNVGEQLAKGSVHLDPSAAQDRIVYYVNRFYVGLIFLVMGFMLLHNFLDFSIKLKEHYRRKKAEESQIRFTRGERIQHLVLMLSFLILAYSGFALKYSQAWWAVPFSAIGDGIDWRGSVHRIAAVIFCVLSIYHIFFLALTQRGREQVKALMFRRKDLTDFVNESKHNLGMKQERPKRSKYTYVEKVEYWALVWGSIIMILTGILLTFENFAMRVFPKWVLDVATAVHFYEAVLATLAIVVWHFYFTVFDPDFYPMNWSMWTGRGNTEENK